MISRWTIAITLILSVAAQAAGAQAPVSRFAIYRATIADSLCQTNAFGYQTAEWMRQNINAAYLAQKATPCADPIITDADIEAYCWGRQEIRLTDAAVSRLWAASKGDQALAGHAYLVFVDGAQCYGGMFWSMLSSQSPPPVPIIIDLPLNNVLLTSINTELRNTRDDARFAERVRLVMEELGKLTPTCADDWWK